ncbi:MAG: hypothetical protein ACO3A4_06020 [Silvanigrellaceae bacterium]
MKRLGFFEIQVSVGLIFSLTMLGCAQSNSESVESSQTTTCVNGICTTTSSETRTSKSGIGGTNVSVSPGGNSSVVVTVGGTSSSSGGISLSPCTVLNAPLGACDVDGADYVLSPRHLGCTSAGNHAWSCQGSFSAAPPYAVVSCSTGFSDSCAKIGVIY